MNGFSTGFQAYWVVKHTTVPLWQEQYQRYDASLCISFLNIKTTITKL
jgi:hypothetical protein